MKQLFTLLIFAVLLNAAPAQTFPYTFSVEHGTYIPLKNSISVNNGQIWDDIDADVPLGFGFQFFGESAEVLRFFGGATAFNVFGLQAIETPLIISYGADLIDRGSETGTSLSPVSFKTEGAPGTRIFKIEWTNAGFFGNVDDFVNTQLWLYEGSNDVELHFGPVQSTSPENFQYSGPLIGFMRSYDFSLDEFQDLWYLKGSVDHPQIAHISTIAGADSIVQTLIGPPGDGLVYRFSTGMVGTGAPAKANDIRIYPSSVRDAFSIIRDDEDAPLRFTILDALGKVIRNGQFNGTTERVEMSGVPAGLYYVNLFSPEGNVVTKKIRKE